MKWAPPTSVRSGTLDTGVSHQEAISGARRKSLVRAIPLSPAEGVGMLQLHPATQGQASKECHTFQQVSGTCAPGHPQASSLEGQRPAAMEHDPDFPKSPFLQHSVALSL